MNKALIDIQTELKAPKDQYSSYGGYKYRSTEDILEALKPLLSKYKSSLYLSDEPIILGNRYYMKATATFTNDEGSIVATGYARESDKKKGMDDSQISGTASSYARKYALNGLFLIDDTKDADTDEYHNQIQAAQKKPVQQLTAKQAYQYKVNYNNNLVPMVDLFKKATHGDKPSETFLHSLTNPQDKQALKQINILYQQGQATKREIEKK